MGVVVALPGAACCGSMLCCAVLCFALVCSVMLPMRRAARPTLAGIAYAWHLIEKSSGALSCCPSFYAFAISLRFLLLLLLLFAGLSTTHFFHSSQVGEAVTCCY